MAVPRAVVWTKASNASNAGQEETKAGRAPITRMRNEAALRQEAISNAGAGAAEATEKPADPWETLRRMAQERQASQGIGTIGRHGRGE